MSRAVAALYCVAGCKLPHERRQDPINAEHRQCGNEGHQGIPGEAFAQDDLAPLIHPDNVKDPLCDVNTEYTKLVFHWTRLPWLHGFTGLEIILAH
jgi:hypothetical protein